MLGVYVGYIVQSCPLARLRLQSCFFVFKVVSDKGLGNLVQIA